MIAFPNAKINLGLKITQKRTDGFHNLETVFYPVDLCDALEIIKSPNGNTTFNSSGLDIPGDATGNLCSKAYRLLKGDFDLPHVNMHLHKVIPMGAGLGGGSSDAAQTLILLNKLFGLKLSENQLLDYARKLGADCAFFILNKPLFAFERGDVFKELKLDLSGYQIVIIKPDVHVNTAEAFANLNLISLQQSLKDVVRQPVTHWKKHLINDFEENIFRKFPEIADIKKTLYEKGAVYASMSGSGSAVYGLFEKPVDLSSTLKKYFYYSTFI